MLRPNLAMDAPPTEIAVGGKVYPIHTDFRVWIQVGEQMRELLPTMETDEELLNNAIVIAKISALVLKESAAWEAGGDYLDFLREVCAFFAGYPHAPVSGRDAGVRTYSFEWDLNEILLAIKCQYGVDLRFGETCHWWMFLEYFRCLCGEHQILKLMEIRGYDGKDAELKKRAARFALPQEMTAADARAMQEVNEMFYNA